MIYKETLSDDILKLFYISQQNLIFRSDRKAPNLATYYFKHIDTDSDMDKIERLEKSIVGLTCETSEEDEEWTFASNNSKSKSTGNITDVNHKPYEKFLNMAQKAEKLVREEPLRKSSYNIGTTVSKCSRVKEWLELKGKDDSCDASGEDDERESQVSEDLNESIATCRPAHGYNSQNTSFMDLEIGQMSKSSSIRSGNIHENRPCSVSSVLQLMTSNNKININPKSFSISESALYPLTKPFSELLNNSMGHSNNSTSSTVEESSALIFEEEKRSPLRRKRHKSKKKCEVRKKLYIIIY